MRLPESLRKYPVCILIGAFTLYTLFSSHTTPGLLGYALTVAVLALSYLYYRSLGAKENSVAPLSIAAALSLYSITTVILFYPTIGTLFRSDDWLILSLFNSIDGFSPESIKKITLFEMFGDIRFQPLAHLLLFVRYIVFGDSILSYHLLNMALHVVTGLCVMLILERTTKNPQLSFLGGLIFIALPGQFDTVVWTYHIYIITGTISILSAVYLTLEYARTKEAVLLGAALGLTLASMLFYEPAILAPASLLVIIYGLSVTGGAEISRRELAAATVAVGVIYAFYIGLTLYGLSLTRETHFVSFSDMATAGNIAKAIAVTAANLWESTFIRGIGVSHIVGIDDIVYLMSPATLYNNFSSIVKIALGLLLILSIKPTKRRLYLIVPLAALALSYIFIIALGRVLTNPAAYVPAQPRYQYFPNAMLVTAMGILLAKRFGSTMARPVLATLLFAILFWNISNTIYANNLVAEAMKHQDYHYYNIKDFLKSNPDSRLLITARPEADWKFSLGTDISLDILFKERLTKFPSKATHLYDGENFTLNPDYRPGPGSELLGDFTAEWIFYRRRGTVAANPIRIIGPAGIYPGISITPEGLLRVDMVVAGTRELHTFSQPYPAPDPDDPRPTHTVHMIVEKDDNVLCLAYNGMLDGRVELRSGYNDWNSDGAGLYGEYFTGSGEPVGIIKLGITPERALYGCSEYARGEIIDPKFRAEVPQ